MCNIRDNVVPWREQKNGSNLIKYAENFSFFDSGKELLDMNLAEIGIPKLHILTVKDREYHYKYYELSGDLFNVVPSIAKKVNIYVGAFISSVLGLAKGVNWAASTV